MSREMLPEREWRTLVKQDPHQDRDSGDLNASSSVLEYGVNLLARDSRKPFQELNDGGTAFEILEQRAHWNPGATKHPCPAELLRIALDGLTGIPIQHCNTLL